MIDYFLPTAFCMPDRDDVTIPGFVVRTVKSLAEPVLEIGQDLAAVGGIYSVTRPLPPMFRLGTTIGLFTVGKTYQTLKTVIHQSNINRICPANNSSQSESCVANTAPTSQTSASSSDITVPSILEEKIDFIKNTLDTMTDPQIVAGCCAILLFLVIITFTVLVAWVVGREYAEKFKAFMVNYPILNKIVLFYLKWGEITSIPARILFVFFIYLELILCLFYLTYIPMLVN